MKIYFIIPARGGSKGIFRKNIRLFGNKPLIQWSIEQSKLSKYFSRVFVSTDDIEIQNIALKCGAEVPFLRPIEISQDLSTDYDFMEHFINFLINNNIQLPDLIVQMRPTYPTRKVEIIDDIITKFIENYENYDSIRTIIENDKTPYKMYNIRNNDLVPLFQEINNIKEPYNQCRQILPKTYLHNGYLDIIKVNTFLEKKSITGDKILPYIMKKEEIDDIDTIEEWLKAEKKIL
jgi:N-acylneuraminate cytidylyltransferase